MRGQVAIEFFLVLALVLGMITVAQPRLFSEQNDQLLLQDALLAKRFVNELTRYSRFALALNGSVLSTRLYSPSKNANCFYAESTRLYCFLGGEGAGDVLPADGNKVFGGLVAEFNLDSCVRPVDGWRDYSFSINEGMVKITC
ncbi:hypothetical protein COX85_00860 [Candidatus Micrarchaeota archaeon CG_4_10_14_0_2_um_filter_55_9]|nr:MAG: hypothetical protein AUJ15_04145 [Candidatus Micrarchaeota archaeon CG1_02_55_41]PIO02967.1 MAG: hypothetical protein COT57_01540 [Candidatus Micrarchaeota archaeon CG09_land_8_20_14_0_10_55_25]PIZ92022.1 MAG: hypothetical protein COX85_00860 [Candidatus Micrarchaeota archaeon CG_4_10_14_0_2_um_filter_55_9]